jgi:hypothetical protein
MALGRWALLFLVMWFLGSAVGTAFALLMVRVGSIKPTPVPEKRAAQNRRPVPTRPSSTTEESDVA